jgi:8-oxo-dGTP pyrophosphatase MutT (NUDIX family)
MREMERTIASAVIISRDGKLLMGKKDPAKGGVYPNAWHIPGGGVEEGETLDQALIREIGQEVKGLDLSIHERKLLPFVGRGATSKTLTDGEKVWVNMVFNRFEVKLEETANVLAKNLTPGDDLVELRWFSRAELIGLEHIPGGYEFFVQAGYIDPDR